MFETYWMLLFPHYTLFVVSIVLVFSAAFSKGEGARRLRSAILVVVLWIVLVFIEVVLPHAKNF